MLTTPLTPILQLFDYLPSVVTDKDVTFKTRTAGETCDMARKAISAQCLPLKAELVSLCEFKVTVLITK